MILRKLLNKAGVKEITGGTDDREIKSLFTDSRKCEKGSMFIAVRGVDADGHNFINAAIDNGATTIVCEEIKEQKEGIIYVTVNNSRDAVATIASNFYDSPSSKLNLVGVTGTNGKTSIATLLYRTFTQLGYSCGLISTIANYVGPQKFATINTTPGPLELNSLIHQMTEKGCEYCFMEVSSHSIDQGRIAGLVFKGGIFTNLTHDHLDYHKTFTNYLNCKKKFFDSLPETAFALTNKDDRNGMIMVQNTIAAVHTYSCNGHADFKTKIVEETIEGMLLNINGIEVWCRFIGNYNAANITAVYGAALLLGANQEETIKIISTLTSVPGRLEYFKGKNNIIAAVDYAHTPDALENVLKTLVDLKPEGDIICVFGCGGNRDKTKRPEMGAIAGKYASRIIVTSDNPRYENPEEIIKEIKAGMDIHAKAKSLFITDRTEAIRTAILTARPSSIILVAGKGHEDYQIVNGVKHHLDDKEIINDTFNLQ